jgi:hypothetical protein
MKDEISDLFAAINVHPRILREKGKKRLKMAYMKLKLVT